MARDASGIVTGQVTCRGLLGYGAEGACSGAGGAASVRLGTSIAKPAPVDETVARAPLSMSGQ